MRLRFNDLDFAYTLHFTNQISCNFRTMFHTHYKTCHPICSHFIEMKFIQKKELKKRSVAIQFESLESDFCSRTSTDTAWINIVSDDSFNYKSLQNIAHKIWDDNSECAATKEFVEIKIMFIVWEYTDLLVYMPPTWLKYHLTITSPRHSLVS